MSNVVSMNRTEVPPTLECEQAVIGATFVQNGAYWACEEIGLRAEHFSHPLHQRLWEAIAELIRAGVSANPITLKPRFTSDPALTQDGGIGYLAKLAVAGVSPMHVKDYARVIVEWSNRRRLNELGTGLVERSLDGSTPQADLFSACEEALTECRAVGQKGGLRPMADVANDALESIERAQKRGKVEGVETGLLAIDKNLGGLADTDLIVLAGRPGMGKSALAGTIAHHVAGEHAVALFTPEMGDEQFAARMLSGEASIETSRMRMGNMGVDEMRRVMAAGERVARLNLFIDETPAIKPSQMRARIKGLLRKVALKLIVVDYLQLMQGDIARRDGNRVQEVSEITAALKGMAKEFHVPVLALAQLSRKVEERDDKRPLLSDLRESGSIEQDADQVWFLYRDEYYAKREEPQIGAQPVKVNKWRERVAAGAGVAELIIAKNRHGAVQTLKIAFQGQYARFGNLE